MNIIELAERDLAITLEDRKTGFGVDVTLITPEGIEHKLIGQSTDVGLVIDSNTGIGVRGRIAEITFRLSTLLEKVGSIPDKTEEGGGWLMRIENINGDNWTFAVGVADVDRKLGVVKISLELIDEFEDYDID
jgi:hypothetical protein